MPDQSPSPWWTPERHADRRPFLLARNAITGAVRDWFGRRDFVEVETPALQVSPGNEAHLHAFVTEAVDLSGVRAPLYLRTSPEFAAKKLLAAGEMRTFELARVWRNRERGPLHHPEFTLLEWYRVGESYETLMADCASLLALAAETAGSKTLGFRGHTIDPTDEPERLT
ncbi:MAG: amino acid--tRNA ligase-related protein, partial [Phenylobacterium sp.]